MLGGGETWLLVHVEAQSRKDPDFEHRMWVYHYRAYDLYRRPVLSMAIL
ncbi:transposase, partial [bacterium CPR1]|nr:transposase [bacterium CPR1]